MKVLWICGLPYEVQEEVLEGRNHGAYAAWSWVMGHLPPPDGVELHIACRAARNTSARSFNYRGVTFHLVPVRSRARVFCLYHFDWRYFRDVVERLQPELIHGWGTEDAYARAALKLAPGRHVIEVQGNVNAYRRRIPMSWYTRFTAWSERMALGRARHVVAENEYSLGSARPMIRTKSVHVVEHPIRKGFLTAAPSIGEGHQMVFIGAINDRKGIQDALNAVARAAPGWKLAVVGNGRPEDLAKFRARIGKDDLAGRVSHHPQIGPDEIIQLMQDSSIFLLPTAIDTGPTSLKEALAMGLWPVCYDNSGPAHYIRRFKFGCLAEDRNPESLAQELKETISGQTWKQPEHRAKVEAVIRPHFSRDRIWQELLEVYRKVVE